ncbi:cupredoxin domain-containing protein [Kitasatospora sp. NPDC059571]|uniref:cupredoxin domain-containing protein n=1 Tax=Kitasatospora sp. NPDC059571 TaxID=3346871 RepID=UPI0036897EC9
MTTARLRLALGAALLALSVSACSSSSGGTSATTPTATTPTATAATTTAAASASASVSGGGSPSAGAVQVTIKDFKFSPDTLSVPAGATVTVVNNDTTAHTLTASDKSFDTGTIEPGKSATFTAPAKSGSFPYICSIHPFMHGTLTVS